MLKDIRQYVRINSHDGELVAILCPTMNEGLRSALLTNFSLALPDHLKQTNTKDDETATTSKSQTVHFDWYNRYSVNVGLFNIYIMILLILFIFRDLMHLQMFIPGDCRKHKISEKRYLPRWFLVHLRSSRTIKWIIFTSPLFLKIYLGGNKMW
jgi:hypothetical protein